MEELRRLNANRNYSGIIEKCKSKSFDTFDAWDLFYLSQAYRKENNIYKAIEVAKYSLNKFKDNYSIPTVNPDKNGKYNKITMQQDVRQTLKNNFAWCLYDLYVKEFALDQEDCDDRKYNIDISEYGGLFDNLEQNIPEHRKCERAFNEVCGFILKEFSMKDIYSPFKETALKYISIYMHRADRHKSVSIVLDKIDIHKLNKAPISVTRKDGKKVLRSSELELWYRIKICLLYREANFEECLKYCREILAEDKSYGVQSANRRWIQEGNYEKVYFTKALCHLELNQPDEGLKILRKLELETEHWYLYTKIAAVYIVLGDRYNSLISYCRACLCGGIEKQKKIIYFIQSKALFDNLDLDPQAEEMAYRLMWLYKYIKDELKQKITGHNTLKILDSTPDYIKEASYDENVAVLVKFWRKHAYRDQPRRQGTIVKLLEGKKAGFIVSDGEKYFFKVNQVLNDQLAIDRRTINEGQKVEFYTKPCLDKKKNTIRDMAVQIAMV